MDCDKAIHQVYSYLDGELTVWKRMAITRHLDECPPCLQGFSFEIELRRVIVSKCHEEVPGNFDSCWQCGEMRTDGSVDPDRER